MKTFARKLLSKMGYRLERITPPQGDLWGGNPLQDLDLYRRLYSADSVDRKRFYNVGAGGFRHPAWTNVDELLSNVVFVRRESGGVLQDSVGEDSSLDDERELMACVEASPATCR